MRIYSLPASVTVITQIKGWKYGKTDFGLSLTELLSDLKIIKTFASNTETDRYPLIDDFDNFDYWKKSNRERKLFIYDEAISGSQRRRAMSKINIEWVSRIPQLSKEGGCHLVVITQKARITESEFFDWTFLRGIWTKLSKKIVKFHYPDMFEDDYVIEGIPRTSVKFDPYMTATFKLKGSVGSSPTKFEELELGEKIELLLLSGWKRKNIESFLKEIKYPMDYERARDKRLEARGISIPKLTNN
jgi:hypothetical protein